MIRKGELFVVVQLRSSWVSRVLGSGQLLISRFLLSLSCASLQAAWPR